MTEIVSTPASASADLTLKKILYNKVWLCPKEVAFDLAVSYKTALNLIKAGKLKAYKVGRHYKIDPRDVQLYIESNKVYNFGA